MSATPVHHTAVTDEPWDGPAAETAMPNDAATLRYCHAWYEAGADQDKKSTWKFPHAKTKGGPANLAACRNGLARRSGADIPDADRAGVKAHLQAHLDDGQKKDTHMRHGGLVTATSLDELREHRSAMTAKGIRSRHRQHSQFELRAAANGTGGTAYSFHGYAAVFDTPFEMWDAWGDPYFEVLAGGSCTRTLNNAADVQFLIGHDESSMPLARTKSGTMTLSADTHGLEVVVPALDMRNPMVQALASAMERGDMDEMSIGFVATQQMWSADWMQRTISEINLHRGDVSMVCWAANPAANGASMTALPVGEAAARVAGAGRESRMPTAPYSAKPGEGNECPQCHSMNDGDAAYCDQCGTAVRPTGASAADEDESQRCGCGNWNATDAKFCDQCGTNLASDQDADNGGSGNGATEAPSMYGWAQDRPGAEQRASADLGLTGDLDDGYAASAPDYNAAEHGPGSPVCPSCGAAGGLDARFCDQCGAGLYDNDQLIADPLSWAAQMRVRVLTLRG